MHEATFFKEECLANARRMANKKEIQELTLEWINNTATYRYTYNFSWLGRPIIQLPQDILAMQEIIWQVKPEIIVETGIAHGGSLIFYASMLELLGGNGFVLGIDVDIREHNRVEIEKHPMFKRITMIEGSSVDKEVVGKVSALVQGRKPVIVALDSNHTHEHVLSEMNLYSSLVTKGSYLVVFDTVVEDMPADFFPDRPWGKGNNPKSAVHAFLQGNDRFVIDKDIENKLLISTAPDGYLRCVKE